MIPKIIHLCWLSGDPYPPEIKKCLDTWKEYLPDYEIWVWDTKRFDINSTLWTKQAFEAKKYAFAADYIRLFALYNYGGIYLDSDVVVYKNFDELLKLPYFIGADQINAFEAAVIGAEKGCKWIKDIMEHYSGREFVQQDGTYDMMTLPIVFHHELCSRGYSFKKINAILKYEVELNELIVFNSNYFNSRDHIGIRKSSQSFCAHNYAGTWKTEHKTNDVLYKFFFLRWLINKFLTFSHKTWRKSRYSWYTIPFNKIINDKNQ